jgi:PAS domain S-box-containing protein
MTTNTLNRQRSDGRHTVELPLNSLVEILPEASALISSDGMVCSTNSRLRALAGDTTGRRCFEALAGLNQTCPFCQFDDFLAGRAEPVTDQIHLRNGKLLSIDVRLLPHSGTEVVIVETMRELSGTVTPHQASLFGMFKALAGMSYEILTHDDHETRIERIISHLRSALLFPEKTGVWIEFGGQIYGDRSLSPQTPGFQAAIEVEGRAIGVLNVLRTGQQDQFDQDEMLFVRLATDLVGRILETTEEVEKLRNSQENYKKLAANLAKEMWTRTEALSHETSYLQGILRCSEDMIITADLDSRIVEFNPGAEKILGYATEDMLGRHVGELWEDPQEREQIMDHVRNVGSIRNHETRLKTKSGQTIEISLSLSILTGEDGRVLGTVGVSKDITEEKAINRELEQLNHNYRETINFISHESKNSLIVISGFVRRLLDSETDPKRKNSLEVVYHHAKFLEAMSRDFLVMADLERGEFHLTRELIRNFQEEVILPAMIGLRERYPDSFGKYDTSMGGVGAIKLYGNSQLLEIVFRNLFGNALKYRYPDGKIAYGVEDMKDRYKFNVWNSGPGVPLDKVESIFEKFYRIQDESTRGKKGTGLGLYNIRRIIEAHGGKIWCETKPGESINFLFFLPKE